MNRDVQIDIAKGLAIFLVVVGHIVPGIIQRIIFLFHIPFFFIVSGYFHRLSRAEIQYLERKALSLLLPYIIYLSIFTAPSITSQLLRLIDHPSVAKFLELFKYIAKLAYGGELLNGTLGVFWFVTCLFLTQQLFNFVVIRINNKKVLLSFTIFLYIVAFIDQIISRHFIFPWGVNVVCCSFLFYFIGAFWGDYIFKIQNMTLLLIAIGFSISSFILISFGLKLEFNMKYTYYGWFIFSPIIAISLTKILLFISNVLSKYNLFKLWLGFSGKASITIMFTHQFFHCRLDKFCMKWPWTMAFVIFIICDTLHYILSTNSLSRALLLGSRKDMESAFDKILGANALDL